MFRSRYARGSFLFPSQFLPNFFKFSIFFCDRAQVSRRILWKVILRYYLNRKGISFIALHKRMLHIIPFMESFP